MYGTLCCDGSITFNGTEEIHIGDPTETAIVLAAHKDGMPKDDLNKQYPRLLEIPFDSNRKRMTTVNKIDGKNVVIVKGAFDVMEPLCVKGDLKTAKSITNSMSEKALRVLAIAYKEIDTVPESPSSEELENDLTFMGLVGMIDPPRPEAKNAVAVCRKAGIKPIMITGDHIVTASAIAKELGILLENDRAITGTELDTMSDRELDQQVEHIAVYLAVAEEYAGAHALLRDKYVPAAPIWVTESGDSGGGGDTWASTYLDVLRTLNELGSFATITDGVIFHNTLASSDYGFLRPGDFEPRPNYYAVLLWNTLMGNTVYHCQNHPMESVHLYCHSRNDKKPGCVYLVINNSPTDNLTVTCPLDVELYLLSSDSEMRSQTICLNGKPLYLSEYGDLPMLCGKKISAGIMELPPSSCSFLVV